MKERNEMDQNHYLLIDTNSVVLLVPVPLELTFHLLAVSSVCPSSTHGLKCIGFFRIFFFVVVVTQHATQTTKRVLWMGTHHPSIWITYFFLIHPSIFFAIQIVGMRRFVVFVFFTNRFFCIPFQTNFPM